MNARERAAKVKGNIECGIRLIQLGFAMVEDNMVSITTLDVTGLDETTYTVTMKAGKLWIAPASKKKKTALV